MSRSYSFNGYGSHRAYKSSTCRKKALNMSIEAPDKLEPEELLHDEYLDPVPCYRDIGIFRECVFVFLVVLTQLLTQAALAQTVITNHTIASDMHVASNPGEQSWFAASFSLTVGTFILVAGRLGDLFGYKRMYIIAFCIISLASLITGFTVYAHSVVFFDVMRGLQGLGFSLAFPNAVAIIGHYYPMGFKRIIGMCLFGAVAPGGFVISSLFNALITTRGWWPWNFWVMSIVTLCVAILAYFVFPLNIRNHDTEASGFDTWGSVSGILGLILINFSLNQGPNTGWEKVYVYVLFIVGILAIAAFFVVERKAKNPLVPKEVMKGETGFVLLCMAAGWSSFGIWLFYTARMATELDHLGYVEVAVRYIPPLVMGFVAAGLSAILLPRVKVSLIMIIAMIAFLLANVIIGTRPVGQVYWGQFFVSFLIGPFGMDLSFPSATVILSRSFPRHQQGLAASLVSTAVNYSISVGLGFAGVVEVYTTRGMTDEQEMLEKGIRNAFHMGMGLGGLGVVTGVAFMIYEAIKSKRSPEEKEV